MVTKGRVSSDRLISAQSHKMGINSPTLYTENRKRISHVTPGQVRLLGCHRCSQRPTQSARPTLRWWVLCPEGSTLPLPTPEGDPGYPEGQVFITAPLWGCLQTGGWSTGWKADTPPCAGPARGSQRDLMTAAAHLAPLHKVRGHQGTPFSRTPHPTTVQNWASHLILPQMQPRQRLRAHCGGMSVSRGSGQGCGSSAFNEHVSTALSSGLQSHTGAMKGDLLWSPQPFCHAQPLRFHGDFTTYF